MEELLRKILKVGIVEEITTLNEKDFNRIEILENEEKAYVLSKKEFDRFFNYFSITIGATIKDFNKRNIIIIETFVFENEENKDIVEFIILHEIGHILNKDLLSKKDDDDDVMSSEYKADEYVFNKKGKEFAIENLRKMFELSINFQKTHPEQFEDDNDPDYGFEIMEKRIKYLESI